MDHRSGNSPQQGHHQWQPKDSVEHSNSRQWAASGYQYGYGDSDTTQMYPPHYGARPGYERSASQQMPRQRTKSRVGILVGGTAVVAMIAGAAGAVAVVDHA